MSASPVSSSPASDPPVVRRILIVGAGVVGRQVAAQCAAFGTPATLYDVDPRQLAAAREALPEIVRAAAPFWRRLGGSPEAVADLVREEPDAARAAADVDLLSESVVERVEVKRAVLAQFAKLCPPHTIFTTNSSYLTPSRLARASGREERFAALHFHVPVWYANAVDVVPSRKTAPEVVAALEAFAGRIGQTPVRPTKEFPGHVFNYMLQALLGSALTLARSGAASPAEIDRAWMTVMKTSAGPHGIMDAIGLDTVQGILEQWARFFPESDAGPNAEYLAAVVRDAGGAGVKSGRGFYRYPDPNYAGADFLGVNALQPLQEGLAAWGAAASTPPAAPPTKVPFELRLREAPLVHKPHRRPRWEGPALVLGRSAAGDALAALLAAEGTACEIVAPCALDSPAWEAALGRLRALRPRHLFVTTAAEPAARRAESAEAEDARFQDGLTFPFFFLQAWLKELEDAAAAGATLAALTTRGGDFGACGIVGSPEGGGLAGLCKAIHLEWAARELQGPATVVVDVAPDELPAVAAERLLVESAVAQAALVVGDRSERIRRHAALEVGWRRGVRLAPMWARRKDAETSDEPFRDGAGGAVPRPGSAPKARASAPAARAAAGGPPERGSRWILTGGARGITARIAEALARAYGAELHLVGRSSLPEEDFTTWSAERLTEYKADVMRQAVRAEVKPNVAWDRVARGIEAQANVQRLRKITAVVRYHACDLLDPAAVRALAEEVSSEGPVTGVVHGAGVETTSRYERKTYEGLRATAAVKWLAASRLEEALRGAPLRWWIGFGSLAGRFGGVGQTDYAAANALMVDWAARLRRRRPDCRTLHVDWPGWSEVGMAARPESRFALEAAGHPSMPPEEGAGRFLEMLVDPPADGVLTLLGVDELPAAFCGG